MRSPWFGRVAKKAHPRQFASRAVFARSRNIRKLSAEGASGDGGFTRHSPSFSQLVRQHIKDMAVWPTELPDSRKIEVVATISGDAAAAGPATGQREFVMTTITVATADTAQAMDKIVERLGDDALILETVKRNGRIEMVATDDPSLLPQRHVVPRQQTA